jgi:hypothetical protein
LENGGRWLEKQLFPKWCHSTRAHSYYVTTLRIIISSKVPSLFIIDNKSKISQTERSENCRIPQFTTYACVLVQLSALNALVYSCTIISFQLFIDWLDTFKTPAPGTYSPEKVHPQGERHAPVYSMGHRTRYRKQDTVPSANSYTLPQLLGSKVPYRQSSAAYSMTGRSKTGNFAEDLAKTPGPGRYNGVDPNVTGKRAPGYSMLGRSYMPGGQTLRYFTALPH